MVDANMPGSWVAAWANTGVSVIADRSAAAARPLNEAMVVFPLSTNAKILGRGSNNGSSTGVPSGV
jgi:hypothetical protein